MSSIQEQTVLEGNSLAAEVLTPGLYESMSAKTTANGHSFEHVIASVRANPDSAVGVYAPSADAYGVFGDFFNPVIERYHGFGEGQTHVRDMDANKLSVQDLDPTGEFINSTRIRVGRNLADFDFPPAISKDDRLKVEEAVVNALMSLDGDLKGDYYRVSEMSQEFHDELVNSHLLFKPMIGDRYLDAAGVPRDWPEGRGIWMTPDRQLIVWVNEEDTNRIISLQNGGNVWRVLDRLNRLVTAMESKLNYAYHPRLGALTACPTNLGTAMRASVHVRIPHFSQTPEFKDFCAKLGLSIRGIHGEHSESEGGVYDISNKRRLGASEVQLVQEMVDGVQALINEEKKAAARQSGDQAAAA